jgi:hypothetical protein
MEITPDEFKCPITDRVMVDPVEMVCGHVFDRRAITLWLMGHNRCPVDNVYVMYKELRPADDLRHAIARHVYEQQLLTTEQLDQPECDFELCVQLLEDYLHEVYEHNSSREEEVRARREVHIDTDDWELKERADCQVPLRSPFLLPLTILNYSYLWFGSPGDGRRPHPGRIRVSHHATSYERSCNCSMWTYIREESHYEMVGRSRDVPRRPCPFTGLRKHRIGHCLTTAH